MSAEDLAGWLSLLFTQVMAGTVEAKIGTACAAIARTLLEAQAAAAQPAIEDLQEQVAVLRALIERGDRGRTHDRDGDGATGAGDCVVGWVDAASNAAQSAGRGASQRHRARSLASGRPRQ